MPLPDLKLCPFCGSSHLSVEPTDDESGFYVTCDVCRCCGSDQFTEADAVTAWNTRPQKTDLKPMYWCKHCGGSYPSDMCPARRPVLGRRIGPCEPGTEAERRAREPREETD